MVERYGDAQLFISKRDICDKIKNRKDNWSALIFVLSYSNSETNIFKVYFCMHLILNQVRRKAVYVLVF